MVTRGVRRRHGEVVLANACTAGFDLHVRRRSGVVEFTYRWRPPARDRVAARILRSRFHLLARAILLQYPALWVAGTRGRAPLHASCCAAAGSVPMLTAPSGVGRSTVVLGEVAAGVRTTGDNLAVGDGAVLWGLVEPLRVDVGTGRRMPHGRRELPLADRLGSLAPDALIVLSRGGPPRSELRPCDESNAMRSLVTSTYMAGELRRYWAFAATLAAATDAGPAHPPVERIAARFAARLPCFELALGRESHVALGELLTSLGAAA